LKDVLARDHYQDGRAAYLAALAAGEVAVDRLKLDELDQDWKDISIVYDIGVNESTLTRLAAFIRSVNAKRPAANRKSETEECEKFLECIFKASKHFSEGAVCEYQAVMPSTSDSGRRRHGECRCRGLSYQPTSACVPQRGCSVTVWMRPSGTR